MSQNEKKKIKKPILISIISAGALVLALAMFFGFSIFQVYAQTKDDKIIKGITFMGSDLGGLSKDEAAQAIKELSETPLSEVTIVRFEDKAFSFAPDAVGYSYDVDDIVSRAFSYGRDGSIFEKIGAVRKAGSDSVPIDPSYLDDPELFLQSMETLVKDQGIEIKPFDLTVYENYAQLKLYKDYQKIDYDALHDIVTEGIHLQKGAQDFLLPLTDGDTITAQHIYDALYIEPKDAQLIKTEDGSKIIPHQIGVLVDIADIEKAMSDGKDEFRIPIKKQYPNIRTDNLQGGSFNDVLGTTKTSYDSSLIGRTRNVTLASSKINNTILNPGDIFSFNKVVGKRTSAAGFSTAIVYTKNGLQEELGGGICQVSSTLYNAALYANMSIVERRNHMYTVGYVNHGLDATVSYGLIDFRFQNNLKNPVKIVSHASGGTLTISVLGIKENNNQVQISSGVTETIPFSVQENPTAGLAQGETRVKQNGANGLKAYASRTILDGSGNVIRTESLGTSVYTPLTKIVEVGTGAPLNAPSEEPPEDGSQTLGETTDPAESPALESPDESPAPSPTVSSEPVETPADTATPGPTPSNDNLASQEPAPDSNPETTPLVPD